MPVPIKKFREEVVVVVSDEISVIESPKKDAKEGDEESDVGEMLSHDSVTDSQAALS